MYIEDFYLLQFSIDACVSITDSSSYLRTFDRQTYIIDVINNAIFGCIIACTNRKLNINVFTLINIMIILVKTSVHYSLH